MADRQPTLTQLDGRGLMCPMLILKLPGTIKTLMPSALVEMLADDAGIVADIEVFEKQTHHRIVEHSETDGVYRLRGRAREVTRGS